MNPFAPKKLEVATAVREAIADNRATDSFVEKHHPPETQSLGNITTHLTQEDGDTLREATEAISESQSDYAKLSQLIADDFPFDESQIAAIDGMVNEKYACLTGAAGTGKTTTTKKLVDSLLSTVSLSAVNMDQYWKSDSIDDDDPEYEAPEKWVPSVAMCAFTGRATQMTKKNFPRDWHGNIMTIHRLLGFIPEFYEDWDDEIGEMRKKMRFIPTYGPDCLLPWDIIIIDEAGMLGLELWHQLLVACKPECRIYMIGDINQLPPVHGKSVFGFAMAKWPAWELTHVHRQQGVNNPIVDNAWRILHGRRPVSEGRFQMVPLKGDASFASRQVRAMMPAMRERGVYDPIRDCIITPINGEEGSRGFALGQLPLNREFALIFNPKSEHPRYIIDGGRVRQHFAVGDKVMATKNDWQAGITNGMTGVIVSIAEHEGYGGERRAFGRVEDVNKWMTDEGLSADADWVDFSAIDLEASMESIDAGMKAKKEKRERGPSSHVVTVRFGSEDHAIEIPFASLSEVGSLMTAYVVTCHKMQGGEAPVIIIILHDSHRAMLYREWLYTAVTRASEKCIVLYTEDALRLTLNKQSIKGSTLQEKVAAFQALNDPKGIMGRAVNVRLPESESTGNRIMEKKAVVVATPRHMTTPEERSGGLVELLKKQREKAAREAEYVGTIHERIVKETVIIRETVIIKEERKDEAERVNPVADIDGGNLVSDPGSNRNRDRIFSLAGPKRLLLAGPPVPLRLTHYPVHTKFPGNRPCMTLEESKREAERMKGVSKAASELDRLMKPKPRNNPWATKLGV